MMDMHHESSIKSALHFMSWCPTSALEVEVETYARSFAQLLNARLSFRRDEECNHQIHNYLAAEVQYEQSDLILFHKRVRLLPIWLKPHPTEKQLLKWMPTSLLILRGLQWPLRKILLVLRDSEFDHAAIAWMGQIASKSSAAVTVLPILAPLPHLFDRISLEHRWLIHYLDNECPLGKRLQQVTQCFEKQNIQGSLHLRQGTITEQMSKEIDNGSYDLLITAADTTQSIMNRMMGELVNPLLSLSDVPVLIAKPIRFLRGTGTMKNGGICSVGKNARRTFKLFDFFKKHCSSKNSKPDGLRFQPEK